MYGVTETCRSQLVAGYEKADTGSGTEPRLCAYILEWERFQLQVPRILGLAWIVLLVFREIYLPTQQAP